MHGDEKCRYSAFHHPITTTTTKLVLATGFPYWRPILLHFTRGGLRIYSSFQPLRNLRALETLLESFGKRGDFFWGGVGKSTPMGVARALARNDKATWRCAFQKNGFPKTQAARHDESFLAVRTRESNQGRPVLRLYCQPPRPWRVHCTSARAHLNPRTSMYTALITPK